MHCTDKTNYILSKNATRNIASTVVSQNVMNDWFACIIWHNWRRSNTSQAKLAYIKQYMFIGINHLKFNFDASRYKSLILLFDQHQNLLAVAHWQTLLCIPHQMRWLHYYIQSHRPSITSASRMLFLLIPLMIWISWLT